MSNKPSRVLMFSGGKDSLACLLLLEDQLDDITVMWCNTGASHPSTHKIMEAVAASVPHFKEVRSDQPGYIAENGYPVDVVPIERTGFGMALTGRQERKFVDWTSCCAVNIWQPLAKATNELGATVVYRGQKNVDYMKAPIKSGYHENGITYLFPLEDWTDEQVFEYLGDRAPEHYKLGERTSRDCVNCTAFLRENEQRINALPHSNRIEIAVVLEDLRSSLNESVRYIDSIIGR